MKEITQQTTRSAEMSAADFAEIPAFANECEKPIKGNGGPREDWELQKMHELIGQGKRIRYIANVLGRNPTTIYRWLWGGRKARNRGY